MRSQYQEDTGKPLLLRKTSVFSFRTEYNNVKLIEVHKYSIFGNYS